LIPFLLEIAQSSEKHDSSSSPDYSEVLQKLNSVLEELKLQSEEEDDADTLTLKIGNDDKLTGNQIPDDQGKMRPEHQWKAFVKQTKGSKVIRKVRFDWLVKKESFSQRNHASNKEPYECGATGWGAFKILVTVSLNHGYKMRQLDNDGKPTSLFSNKADYLWLLQLDGKSHDVLVTYELAGGGAKIR
jgi:hypothetical protein